jgi:hypothetical protein
MMDELRFVVEEIKRAPHALGPKEHFEILVRQMTQSERAALASTLIEMINDLDPESGRALQGGGE